MKKNPKNILHQTQSSQLPTPSSQPIAPNSKLKAQSSEPTTPNPKLKAHNSQPTTQNPQLIAQGSRLKAQGSRLKAQGSRLKAQGSRLTTHNSQPKAHSSQLTAHSSQLTAPNSQLTAHNSQPKPQTFYKTLKNYPWAEVAKSIYEKKESDVLSAINSTNRNLEDFKALISPAAEPFLEQMAKLSHELTQKRFGKTIQMYVPLYLSNECQNICTYCGFSLDVKIPRKTLIDDEILQEVKVIKSMGYDHVLLVTGEANKTVGVDYFKNAVRLLKPHFSHIAIEVQPLEQKEYEVLIAEGVNTVLVYQETYNETDYKKHHPKGRKSNYQYRVETHDRLGRAGIHKMGLGVLIGLEDWRVDSMFNAMHLNYLEKKYWKSKYTVSFPRLRPCAGGLELKSVITDKQLVQLICAYRLFNEELELSMSTRESARFRDNIIKLGITSISADSKTDPGGYANPKANLEQFEIDDTRSTREFLKVIRKQGYEPVFKDWDLSLQE